MWLQLDLARELAVYLIGILIRLAFVGFHMALTLVVGGTIIWVAFRLFSEMIEMFLPIKAMRSEIDELRTKVEDLERVEA